MTVIFPLFIVLAIAAGFSTWLASGLAGLVGLTSAAAAFCQSLMVKCLAYSNIARITFLWLGALVFVTGLAWALFRGARGLLTSRMAVKRLPVKARAGRTVLIDDPKNCIAFTHGLLYPRIYLSTGLLRELSHEELKRVFLHELHHRRGRDPLKFFLASLLKDAFFYIPLTRFLNDFVHEKGEEKADKRAASGDLERLSLAGALVKVARHNTLGPAHAGSYLTGDHGSRVEVRIRRLVEGTSLKVPHPGARAVLSSVLIAILLLVSLGLPMASGIGSVEACTTEHCSTHMDMLGDDCAAHCDTPTSIHHTH